MSRNGRVIVAMSGGVDSSAAAALLKEQGYDCVGVFMRVGVEAPEAAETCTPLPPEGRRLKHGCCSASNAADARRVAGLLGIPFYALNFRDDFERIIDYFVDEYGRARTPNPCIRCNIELKFGKLLRYADAMGAEFVATGHYARVLSGTVGGAGILPAIPGGVGVSPGGVGVSPANCVLARARHLAKDQSYVLFGIRRDHLPRCLFPVGELADKSEVRRVAASLGLPVHDKPDSQEICFVPDQDYKALLRQRRPAMQRPGDVLDRGGRVVGRHEGVANYTIGQRRGTGLALGFPVYVTQLDAAANTVTVGEKADLLSPGLTANGFNWLIEPPLEDVWRAAHVKIRHMHEAAPGRFRRLLDGRVEVRFDEPQSAVTPGQAAVLYQVGVGVSPGGVGVSPASIVLGGGWIVGSTAVEPP